MILKFDCQQKKIDSANRFAKISINETAFKASALKRANLENRLINL